MEYVEKIIKQLEEKNEKLENAYKQATAENEELTRKLKVYDKDQSCLLLKIQRCKKVLNEAKLKKSGKNTYNKYNYYELEDINAPICDALLDEGLASLFQFDRDSAVLRIIDSSTGAYIEWITPLQCSPRYIKKYAGADDKKGDVGELMKDQQALQTYARRALYLQALEIAEPNTIERGKPTGNNKTNVEINLPDTTLFNQITADFIKARVDITAKTVTNKLKSMVNNGKISQDEYAEAISALNGGLTQ